MKNKLPFYIVLLLPLFVPITALAGHHPAPQNTTDTVVESNQTPATSLATNDNNTIMVIVITIMIAMIIFWFKSNHKK